MNCPNCNTVMKNLFFVTSWFCPKCEGVGDKTTSLKAGVIKLYYHADNGVIVEGIVQQQSPKYDWWFYQELTELYPIYFVFDEKYIDKDRKKDNLVSIYSNSPVIDSNHPDFSKD